MTTVYFIRHAQADNSVADGRIRPLTEKGRRDRALVTAFLGDKSIDAVLSSPFKRAVDTVADFAERYGLDVTLVEDFRERKGDSGMGKAHPEFAAFQERQWSDFRHTFSDGESLAQVQDRNIAALNRALEEHRDQNIVIGTHGTALSTIIHSYDPAYGFADFMAVKDLLPWVVKMVFREKNCVEIQKINLFR